MRHDWERTWMDVAQAMSRRSKCTNRQVGAVIVDSKNRPISVGYNGAPAGFKSGFPNSCGDYCPRSLSSERGMSYSNCVAVHAEANALLFADRRDYEGGSIYITNPCCFECAKLIANSGLTNVIVQYSESDFHADIETPIEFLNNSGVQVTIIRKEHNEL